MSQGHARTLSPIARLFSNSNPEKELAMGNLSIIYRKISELNRIRAMHGRIPVNK